MLGRTLADGDAGAKGGILTGTDPGPVAGRWLFYQRRKSAWEGHSFKRYRASIVLALG